MRSLFENEYSDNKASTPSKRTTSGDATKIKSKTRSILDADFENDEESQLDEVAKYIVEKAANKDTDVLMWWKVRFQAVI